MQKQWWVSDLRQCCLTDLNLASGKHISLSCETITCILQKFILGLLFSLHSGSFIIASERSSCRHKQWGQWQLFVAVLWDIRGHHSSHISTSVCWSAEIKSATKLPLKRKVIESVKLIAYMWPVCKWSPSHLQPNIIVETLVGSSGIKPQCCQATKFDAPIRF